MILPPFIVCRPLAGQSVQWLGGSVLFILFSPPLGESVPAGGGPLKLIPLYHSQREMESPLPLPTQPEKAPAILTRKRASAGWWVPYSIFTWERRSLLTAPWWVVFGCYAACFLLIGGYPL